MDKDIQIKLILNHWKILKLHSLCSIAFLSFLTNIIGRLIQIQKQTWKFGETDFYANTIEAGPA